MKRSQMNIGIEDNLHTTVLMYAKDKDYNEIENILINASFN